MSAVLETRRRNLPAPWRAPLAALAGVVVALVLLYWSTLMAMVGIWDRSGTFAHCYLVAPISLWLVWRCREELAALTPRPAGWVLVPMVAVAFAWLLGEVAGVNALTQFAFTALLVLSVPLVLGLDVARRITFPLLFLFFMVPFGEFLLPWLMEWTADFTVAAVRFSGIPVYREGLQFVIPTGTWSVVEACSGVRYLIASFMVGSLFAYLNYTSTKRRVVFGLVSLAVPLLANWMRAYMIVMLGHLSGNRLAVGVDHLIYGWVFFGLIVGVMFFIGSRWAEPPADAAPPAALALQAPGLASRQNWFVASLAVLVLLLPQGLLWKLDADASRGGNSAPFALGELSSTSAATAPATFVPELQNPTATALRGYVVADGTVYVHIGYYRRQGFGHKLVTSENSLVKALDKDWQMSKSGQGTMEAGSGPMAFRQAEVLGGSVGVGAVRRQRFDVRRVYWVDGGFTVSDAVAALLGVRGKLLGRGDDGAMVTIYTEGEDKAQTTARLEAFIRTHTTALERQLVTYRNLR